MHAGKIIFLYFIILGILVMLCYMAFVDHGAYAHTICGLMVNVAVYKSRLVNHKDRVHLFSKYFTRINHSVNVDFGIAAVRAR